MQPQQIAQEVLRKPKTLAVTSPAFATGKRIPREHTCQGDDVSPALDVGNLPEGTVALAVTCHDPDAPRGTFTHWLAWDLPPRERLEKGVDVVALGGVEGPNGFGSVGYRGPCPPSGTHRYDFRVFALGRKLGLPPSAAEAQVWEALQRHALAWGDLQGVYAKS